MSDRAQRPPADPAGAASESGHTDRLVQISRRSYLGSAGLGTLGASMSLTLGACVRRPKEKILPYARRPEDLIPGTPRYFATSASFGGSVLGLLVESQDGRPTKIEGNPQHPYSHGGTNAWAQASVLDLYSPQRSQKPRSGGGEPAWNWTRTIWRQVDQLLDKVLHRRGGEPERTRTNGEGLALLIGEVQSPTLAAQLQQLVRKVPGVKLYRHDAAHPAAALAGTAMVGMEDALPLPVIDKAEVILALDSDFLGSEGDPVRNARQFADSRRIADPTGKMNRLYAVEPCFSVTGARADNRLQIRASEVGPFLAALARHLFSSGLVPADGAGAVVERLGKSGPAFGKWVPALANDLIKHRGRSLILVGYRQPPWVHALAHLVNASLGNVGQTVTFVRYRGPRAGTIGELTAAVEKKQIDTLIILGGNPAYDAPADLDFGRRVAEVPLSIHHSMFRNETSRLATWHIPASHYLESWGDLEASDGTSGIQQPLIAPLYNTISEIELLERVLEPPRAGTAPRDGHEIVRAHWMTRMAAPAFEKGWRRWLHDGVIPGTGGSRAIRPALSWSRLIDGLPPADADRSAADGLELVFQLDPSVYDGRYAANPWLQELPDPLHKLTWDNAALMNSSTAARLGVVSEDMVAIEHAGRRLEIVALVTPGVADGTIVLPLGYGRKGAGVPVGPLARGGGFDVHVLRTSKALHVVAGAVATKTRGRYRLAAAQEYGSLTPTTHTISGLPTAEQKQGFKPRSILRETSLEGYRADPQFVERSEVLPEEKIKSLFTEAHPWKRPAEHPGGVPQQWGMSIDLGACIGCNACSVACQAENNIPVVGKDRVRDGRIMAWIRVDRYYSGSEQEPVASMQPILCQHCENAPCETVCPVNATAHSPDGLNDMAYNRCIGTRYCSNNCPYKVRRFNFFNYNKENDESMPLLAMQRNPDVTVRFRGVVEKCTYCVQRISQAKIAAKRDGSGKVPDGTVVPACAQVCPTRAIVFGDVSDPNSAVSRLKAMDRDYSVLAELNTKPRTSYLAGLRNPNPDV